MMDLFDVSMGGAGWHITSHIIAIAALFVACFAIAGYITFRDESVPGSALKDQDVDLDDIDATTLTLSGAATVGGDLTVSGAFQGLESAINIKTAFGASLDNNSILNADVTRLKQIRRFLGTKTSLTAAETQSIFQDANGLASQTATIDAAVAGALAGADGFATVKTPQFLTGNRTTDGDIGAANVFATMVTGDKFLIIFGGNTLTATRALTLTLDGGHGADASGSLLLVNSGANAVTENLYTAATATDAHHDITLTAGTSDAVILPGSFIYIESIDGNDAKTCVKAFIELSSGGLTLATAAG